MKSQLIAFFGIAFLACVLAQDNSTDTGSLIPSEDVKPAISEAQASNQKVDNQELDKADVKDKANSAIDAVGDKLNSAKDAASSAADSAKEKASDAADSVKSGADAAADKTKEGADVAKDKLQNSASSMAGFSFASTVILLALTRL